MDLEYFKQKIKRRKVSGSIFNPWFNQNSTFSFKNKLEWLE